MFIVFEGLDGSGKTTHLQRLAAKLEAEQDCWPIVTCEPSNNPVGQLIRQALRGEFGLENETMAMLFAADRYQHVAYEILPALDADAIVLCDRYYYSNFVYQGGEPEAFSRLELYNAYAMQHCKPDIVLFLDVEPAECMRRIAATRTSSERYDQKLEEMTAFRTRFLSVFEQLKESDRLAVIDANADEDTVAARIWQRIKMTNKAHDKPQ